MPCSMLICDSKLQFHLFQYRFHFVFGMPWNTRNYAAKCKRYIYYYNQEWAFSVSNLIFTFSQFFFETASTQDMLCGSNIISPLPKFIIVIVIVVFIDIQSRVGWWLLVMAKPGWCLGRDRSWSREEERRRVEAALIFEQKIAKQTWKKKQKKERAWNVLG